MATANFQESNSELRRVLTFGEAAEILKERSGCLMHFMYSRLGIHKECVVRDYGQLQGVGRGPLFRELIFFECEKIRDVLEGGDRGPWEDVDGKSNFSHLLFFNSPSPFLLPNGELHINNGHDRLVVSFPAGEG